MRIATHPDATGMGYGTAALQMLTKYYQCEIASLDEGDGDSSGSDDEAGAAAGAGSGAEAGDGSSTSVLATETLAPRKKLPPLLVALPDRAPDRLHWLGTSFGMTNQLFNFWNRWVLDVCRWFGCASNHPLNSPALSLCLSTRRLPAPPLNLHRAALLCALHSTGLRSSANDGIHHWV